MCKLHMSELFVCNFDDLTMKLLTYGRYCGYEYCAFGIYLKMTSVVGEHPNKTKSTVESMLNLSF